MRQDEKKGDEMKQMERRENAGEEVKEQRKFRRGDERRHEKNRRCDEKTPKEMRTEHKKGDEKKGLR
ncbi:hypothetical protein QQF64_021754 [Cirrhinus molitorella]|uniref:Uncharacterized protein n=1 Tax=Cirrhinus molitorella TaxID=172907 RepID=A0ABR3L680_9TELE